MPAVPTDRAKATILRVLLRACFASKLAKWDPECPSRVVATSTAARWLENHALYTPWLTDKRPLWRRALDRRAAQRLGMVG